MIRRLFGSLVQYLRTSPRESAQQATDEISAEIEFHLAESIREQTARGVSPEAAQKAALAQFGDVRRTAKECVDVAGVGRRLWHYTHVAATVMLAAAVLFLVFRSYSLSQPLGSTRIDKSLAGDISGKVIDERARPVANAHVLVVVKTWPSDGYRQQAHTTMTDSDGRFSVLNVYPHGEMYEVQIAAIADGRLLRSEYFSKPGGTLDPIEFRLDSSTPLALRFESRDGRPIEGVAVIPHQRTDGGGRDHLVYFQGADPITRRSDASGRVRLPYFRPGEHAVVFVQFPDNEWQTRELVVPTDQQTVVLRSESGS